MLLAPTATELLTRPVRPHGVNSPTPAQFQPWLEKGLKLFTEQGFSGEQVDAGPARRINLMALGADAYVVEIELKAGQADRHVCDQIHTYMGWIKENVAAAA